MLKSRRSRTKSKLSKHSQKSSSDSDIEILSNKHLKDIIEKAAYTVVIKRIIEFNKGGDIPDSIEGVKQMLMELVFYVFSILSLDSAFVYSLDAAVGSRNKYDKYNYVSKYVLKIAVPLLLMTTVLNIDFIPSNLFNLFNLRDN